MLIKKSKINGSSFALYHDNDNIRENWVSQLNEELKLGNTYFHSDYGNVKVESINIHQKIEVNSFLFFWFKVKPEFETTVVFSFSDQGMACVTSLLIEKFIKGLNSHLMFQNCLEQKVQQLK